MFWQEDDEGDKPYEAPDDIVDLVFRIDCRQLPLDHAWALSTAIQAVLPWFAGEKGAGMHQIHVAESANGWFRPQDVEHEVLHLPRRARMILRLPKARLEDARALVGAELDIDGHRLRVGEPSVKKLQPASPLVARYVAADPELPEEAFLSWVAEEIQAMDIPVRKLMAGKTYAFRTPEGPVSARTVMIADLKPEASVRLQQEGIGPRRELGCGLFIPHKGIKSVRETN